MTSSPFRFIVGEERAEFTLHSALVARQSDKLNALVNNEFPEARDQSVLWDSVDKATFIRFAQYVYCGDYEAEGFKVSPSTDGSKADPSAEGQNNDWGWEIAPKKEKNTPSGQARALIRFKKPKYEYEGATALEIEENNDVTKEYSEIFLAHARLYVFADYHRIERLQQMTLHKLHQLLSAFQLQKERKGDIVKLLRFCFPEDSKKEGCPDKLKDLIVEYVACHMYQLWDEEFQELYLGCEELILALTTALIHQASFQ